MALSKNEFFKNMLVKIVQNTGLVNDVANKEQMKAFVRASKIDAATTIESGSQWNTTENPDLPTGASLWGDTGSMIVVAFVIAAVSIVIWLLRTGV